MGFSVNTNAGALVALQNLNKTTRQLNVVQSRINTGLKVAGAKDDASIFAIAQKQRAELGGLNAVKSSLARATGAIDVALAGAEAVSDLLIQLKEKSVAAKDPGQSSSSQTLLDNDYQQLVAQIDTIVNNAEFNGVNALQSDNIVAIVSSDANATKAITIAATDLDANALQSDNIVAIVSSDANATKAITIAATDLDANALSLSGTSITSSTNASAALTAIDTAIDTVNSALSALGAGAKRIEIVAEFTEKLSDAIEIGIGALVDADLARESANLQSLQVKQQLGLQALSIANQAPGTVLSLFR